jgi:hypothetical protein
MTRRAWLASLPLLAALALALLALGGCSRTSMASASSGEVKSLTVDQVAALVAAHDGKTFVFDNNDKERWARSHVPGAKWVDYDNVTAADLPADKGAMLVFYCASEL